MDKSIIQQFQVATKPSHPDLNTGIEQINVLLSKGCIRQLEIVKKELIYLSQVTHHNSCKNSLAINRICDNILVELSAVSNLIQVDSFE